MYLKRLAISKKWPIERKGTKYVALSKGGFNTIPILIIIRDILNLARTKKEVKKAIAVGDIVINERKLKNEHFPIALFDVIKIIPMKKNYRAVLDERGKFNVEEISEKESKEKIVKIINKRLLKGKKVQINLSDGKNYLSDVKCDVGDSVIINLEKRTIDKIIPMKEHHEGLIISGKNAGEIGKIIEIDKEKNRIKFLLEKQKKEIEVNPKSIIIIK